MSASGREPALGRRLSVVVDACAMPDERLTSLSVVLPCHDEQENVAAAISQAAAAAAATAAAFEIGRASCRERV